MVNKDRIRNRENRIPKRIILISYEGETERRYFSNFSDRNCNYRILRVLGNETDPVNLVKHVIEEIKSKGLDLNYDKAFCIFDTDTNSMKDKQINEALSLASENGIVLITSNPCIELWFLLHYEYTTAFFTNNGILKRLQNYFSKYKKGYNIYPDIEDKISNAINNSKKLEKYQISNHDTLNSVETNPYTGIYKIIEELNR